MISINLAATLIGLGLGYLFRNKLNNGFWQAFAWIVTREPVRDWLICRSFLTPYEHITSADGKDVYMYRWWLFNPYPFGKQSEGGGGYIKWLPSIRIHQIMRPDMDRHLHSHPWNARTIILDGWYQEERPGKVSSDGMFTAEPGCVGVTYPSNAKSASEVRAVYMRRQGHTGTLKFGEYHRISQVSPGGVFTMFITDKFQGDWAFDVDGVAVPHDEYLSKMKDSMAQGAQA